MLPHGFRRCKKWIAGAKLSTLGQQSAGHQGTGHQFSPKSECAGNTSYSKFGSFGFGSSANDVTKVQGSGLQH